MSRTKSQSAYMRARKAGCKHPKVSRYDCGCSWGCNMCHINWWCGVCKVHLKHKPKAAEVIGENR